MRVMNHYIVRLLGFWWAAWHLRQPPLRDASAEARARWCRDHCGQFAGRWFALGVAFWLVFMTPFVSHVAVALIGVIGIILGIVHIAWQLIAQKRAGPPPIEPPVEFDRRSDHRDE